MTKLLAALLLVLGGSVQIPVEVLEGDTLHVYLIDPNQPEPVELAQLPVAALGPQTLRLMAPEDSCGLWKLKLKMSFAEDPEGTLAEEFSDERWALLGDENCDGKSNGADGFKKIRTSLQAP